MSVFGAFLVRISPHSAWIRRDAPYLSVFSPKAGKYRPEKFRRRTLFAQCNVSVKTLLGPKKPWIIFFFFIICTNYMKTYKVNDILTVFPLNERIKCNVYKKNYRLINSNDSNLHSKRIQVEPIFRLCRARAWWKTQTFMEFSGDCFF